MELDCRFTDRSLIVKPHGSGVKLTIIKPELDTYGCVTLAKVTVFLDAKSLHSLAHELSSLNGQETWPPQPNRDAKVEDALRNLTAALIGAGY